MGDITVSSAYKNAWQKLHGSKKSIWSIAIVIILILLTITFLSKLITIRSYATHYWLDFVIFPITLHMLVGPFYSGSFMVAIKRFRNDDVNIKTGYQCLGRYIALAIMMAIIGLLSNLISIIINIPLIGQSLGPALPYFDLLAGLSSLLVYTFFLLSAPLIIDKNYSIKKALSESCRKIKSHWLRIFVTFFLAYLLLFILYLPSIIGLIIHREWLVLLGGAFFIILFIWFLPFLFLLAGGIYHQLIDGPDI